MNPSATEICDDKDNNCDKQVDEGVTYVMNFQFRLDTSQLPRPLQIGAVGRSGWNMVLARSVPLSVGEAAR